MSLTSEEEKQVLEAIGDRVCPECGGRDFEVRDDGGFSNDWGVVGGYVFCSACCICLNPDEEENDDA